MLVSRVARKVKDTRLLKLIRRYLNAGIMKDGMVSIRHAGTPQGSPLSPLLSNILLDDFDKELERRGHCFCRYADDVNVYVRSRRAGERVMESLTRFLEGRMRLKVNRTKSAVDRPWKRTFLGYTVTTHFSPRLKPAPASLKRAKDRIRHITHAGRGRNIRTVIDEVNRFTRGWVGYFRRFLSGIGAALAGSMANKSNIVIDLRGWRTPSVSGEELQALGKSGPRYTAEITRGLPVPRG